MLIIRIRSKSDEQKDFCDVSFGRTTVMSVFLVLDGAKLGSAAVLKECRSKTNFRLEFPKTSADAPRETIQTVSKCSEHKSFCLVCLIEE